MPARTFCELLDALAAEYGQLKEENCELRARLSWESSSGEGNCGSEVELRDRCSHTLVPEVVHFTAPSGFTSPHDSNNSSAHMMEASAEDASVVFASEPDKNFGCEVQAPPVDDGAFADLRRAPPLDDLRRLSLTENSPPSENGEMSTELKKQISANSMTSSEYNEHIQSNWQNYSKEKQQKLLKEMHARNDEDYQRKPIFANVDDMKERVRAKLTKHSYSVTEYYWKTGYCQKIARNQAFETTTLMVIGLNAVWIWIDTDYNKEDNLIDAHPVFQVAEHLFCTYFFLELLIRFGAFQKKRNCFRDGWFVFDFFLVTVMVVETWFVTILLLATSTSNGSSSFGDASVLRIFRLMRLLRMGRMARLLRAMPELVILIKGMVAAARSVFFTLVLLLILLYIFGIACTQLLKETDVGDTYFKKVPQAMHTLWLRGALVDEVVVVMDEIEKVSLLTVVVLDIFILAAALTVMNMLVGVLCEVVSAVAASEREEIALTFVKAKVERIFTETGIDKDGNQMISKEEFVEILDNREAARAIQDLGVDVVGLVDFADVFFAHDTHDDEYEKELSFTEFMEAVVSLRGSNQSTVKDIMDLRKALAQSVAKIEKQVQNMQLSNGTPMANSRISSIMTGMKMPAVRSDEGLPMGHCNSDGAMPKKKGRRLLSCVDDEPDSPLSADDSNNMKAARDEKLRRSSNCSSEKDNREAACDEQPDIDTSPPASSAKEELDAKETEVKEIRLPGML